MRGRNKYGAQKTFFDNRRYDSKGEAILAQRLSLLQKGGQFTKVEPQVTFWLYGKNGSKICKHIVDFLTSDSGGRQEVFEYKGVETASYKIKLKLFKDNYQNIKYNLIKKEDL